MKRKLFILLMDVVILSFGHAFNSSIIILIGLMGFAAIVLFSPKPIFFPIMLFYLPWSPIMKFSPGSFTLYTIIVPIFLVTLLLPKKENEIHIILPLSSIVLVCMIVIFTLIAKLVWGYSISMPYLMFMMMLVFMPTYLGAFKDKLFFEWCIMFFSVGIISACISSKILMRYPQMLQYIDVFQLTGSGLTRLSGFYGDPNFYSTHILAAISGLLIVALNKRGKNAVFLIAMVVTLVYFGFLSVSKMFLLVLFGILSIWIIGLLSLSGKVRTKIAILLGIVAIILIVVASGIFTDEINMYLIRFAEIDSTSTLTTGRSDILPMYISFLGNNIMALLLGQGYTPIFVGGLREASHNSIVEAVYQFGWFGSILIILWVWQLGKIKVKDKKNYKNTCKACLIIVLAFACFSPWLSLDILFFDEFFYITTLFFLGKDYVYQMDVH